MAVQFDVGNRHRRSASHVLSRAVRFRISSLVPYRNAETEHKPKIGALQA